jgi:hypothetical protein
LYMAQETGVTCGYVEAVGNTLLDESGYVFCDVIGFGVPKSRGRHDGQDCHVTV